MTNPQNIIEVVKELQAAYRDYKDGCIVDDAALLDDICRHFPAIAQALLTKDDQLKIAVGALEEMEKQQKDGSGDGTATYWHCNQCGGNKPLEGVLSQIKSLEA